MVALSPCPHLSLSSRVVFLASPVFVVVVAAGPVLALRPEAKVCDKAFALQVLLLLFLDSSHLYPSVSLENRIDFAKSLKK